MMLTITPIKWVYQSDTCKIIIGVIVSVNNGDTQYLTIDEYYKFLKKYE